MLGDVDRNVALLGHDYSGHVALRIGSLQPREWRLVEEGRSDSSHHQVVTRERRIPQGVQSAEACQSGNLSCGYPEIGQNASVWRRSHASLNWPPQFHRSDLTLDLLPTKTRHSNKLTQLADTYRYFKCTFQNKLREGPSTVWGVA